jgi:hypothetical protein
MRPGAQSSARAGRWLESGHRRRQTVGAIRTHRGGHAGRGSRPDAAAGGRRLVIRIDPSTRARSIVAPAMCFHYMDAGPA